MGRIRVAPRLPSTTTTLPPHLHLPPTTTTSTNLPTRTLTALPVTHYFLLARPRFQIRKETKMHQSQVMMLASVTSDILYEMLARPCI